MSNITKSVTTNYDPIRGCMIRRTIITEILPDNNQDSSNGHITDLKRSLSEKDTLIKSLEDKCKYLEELSTCKEEILLLREQLKRKNT